MSKVLGKDLVIGLKGSDGNVIAVAGNTDCTLDLSSNTIDATTKDDDEGWESQLPASKSWSVSWNGLICEDSATVSGSTTYSSNADNIIDAFVNATPVTVTFVIGNITYSGTGIITSSNFSGAVKDLAKCSFSITGQGELEKEE